MIPTAPSTCSSIMAVSETKLQQISELFLSCRKCFQSLDDETINTKFRDVKEHAFGNIKFEYLCPYVQDFMKRLSKLIYDDNFQYVEKNDPGPDCGFEIDLDDRGWHLESDLQMTYKDNLLYDDPLFKDMYLLVEWGAWSVQIDSTTGELYTFVGDYYDSKEPYEHASFIEWWEMSLSKFLLDVQSHQSK